MKQSSPRNQASRVPNFQSSQANHHQPFNGILPKQGILQKLGLQVSLLPDAANAPAPKRPTFNLAKVSRLLTAR